MEDMTLVENLKSELRRGTQILAVLNQLKSEQYGYSLLQSLVDQGINIEAGTLYPLLRRLESQGLLNSMPIGHNVRLTSANIWVRKFTLLSVTSIAPIIM